MLLFKLFEEKRDDVIPIAGIIAPEKTSKLVVVRDHIQQLYDTRVHKIEINNGVFMTPYSADTDHALDMNVVKDGLMVSDDPEFNCYYQLKLNTTAAPNVRLFYVQDNRLLTRYKVEFWNATTPGWQETPDGSGPQTVRVRLHDEDVSRAAVMVVYDISGQENHQELVDGVLSLYTYNTDWTLSIQNNQLTITPAGSLSGTTTLYVKQNALNRIQVLMPYYQWHHDWYLLVRKGVIITENQIFITQNLPYGAPAALHARVPVTFINRSLIQVPIPDINTSITPTVYFNNVKQDDIVEDYASRFGIIRLKRSVPADVICQVDYEINTGNWLELRSVDFNPHRNHDSGKHFTRITDVGISFWLQPANMGYQILRSYSSEPGLAYYENSDGHTIIRGEWKQLATVKTIQQAQPDFVDIRQPGGGLKEEYRDSVDTTGYTDWGFYDGKPIDNISIVVRIPRSKYDEIYQSYRDQGFEELQAITKAQDYIRNVVERFAPVGVNIIYQDKNGDPLFS